MNPEVQSLAIVLRGQFSPIIFQPSWLASENLIRKKEADAAEVEIIHPNATIYSIEWFQLRVLSDRFQVMTTLPPYFEPLRDLVLQSHLQIFLHSLEESPHCYQ